MTMSRQSRSQPQYHAKTGKAVARYQIMTAYVDITGRPRIPADGGFWTLCHFQPNVPGSEINQMSLAGFLKKNQYFGIDHDQKIIAYNKNLHGEAHWFHGDWLDVIRQHFNIFRRAALVHFDSIFAVDGSKFSRYLASTLNMCNRPGVVVAATALLSSPYEHRQFKPEGLLNFIDPLLRHPEKWRAYSEGCEYKTSKTRMGIFFFERLK